MILTWIFNPPLSPPEPPSTTQPKNAQVVKGLLTSCNNLLQQADIRMCLHRATAFDNKSLAIFQQTCCKLIISTGCRLAAESLLISNI